jgi:hypothetical protein
MPIEVLDRTTNPLYGHELSYYVRPWGTFRLTANDTRMVDPFLSQILYRNTTLSMQRWVE